MENLPTLLCISFITVAFVIPMWAYINLSERRARIERDKAIEAGRHEPVTIQPYVDLSVCMGSGACVPACPEDVLKVLDGQAIAVNMAACIGHATCVTACPVGAIELVFGSEKRGIDIPRVGPDFQTNVPGVYIAGELGGMGLIASAAEQGVKALDYAAKTLTVRKDLPEMVDMLIVGAGPAGIAAAASAKKQGLSFALVDQDAVGGAVRHYPRKKLVFTRPMNIPGYGRVNLKTLRKEELVALFEQIVTKLAIEVSSEERVDKISRGAAGVGFDVLTSKRTVHAQRVILALGRRGTPRKLDVAGEDTEKVAYSLLEPDHYQYDHLLVVGGGDSAVEAALQLSEQPGNKVFLSYRGAKINRPKEKNIQLLRDAVRQKRVDLLLESKVAEISADRVVLEQHGEQLVLPNDHVFVMVGGVLPTKFLQETGIKIQKHYGKRIEAVDETGAASQQGGAQAGGRPPASALAADPTAIAASPPAPAPAPAGPSPLGREFIAPGPAGHDDQTVPRMPGDEQTVALPDPSQLAALAAPEAQLPPPPAPSGPPPRPVIGLARLDTHTLPKNASAVDELPRDFGASDAAPPAPAPAPGAPAAPPGERREVTEIQPLKRVAHADDLPLASSAPSEERTIARREEHTLDLELPGPPPQPDISGAQDIGPLDRGDRGVVVGGQAGAEHLDALGRVVARKPQPQVEQTSAGPEPQFEAIPAVPSSPISARLSRVAGRGPGARGQGAPGEPRPDFRKRGANNPPTGRPSDGLLPASSMSAPPGQRHNVAAPAGVGAYVTEARALLDAGQPEQALRVVSTLSDAVAMASESLSAVDLASASRWVHLLEGESRNALGQWAAAVSPLEAGLEAARALDDPEALGPVLAALGRALHHSGAYDRSHAALEEALFAWQPEPANRTGILRLLGDQALRRGEIELAEQHWEEALSTARAAQSADAEARALRGLANCTAVRGHYPEALDQLTEAFQMLHASDAGVVGGPHPAIAASTLVRIIELENVLGRYGPALARSELLMQIVAAKRLQVQRAEGLALLGETFAAIGMTDQAAEAAASASAAAAALGPRGFDALIRAARVWCDVGRFADALGALDQMGTPPESPIDDPVGQAMVVRARALVKTQPSQARDLANDALARPNPLLAMRTARILLDAALALHEAGADSAARSAVKRGLKALQGSGNKGLKLELLIAMYLAAPDHRVVEAAARTALRVMEELPEQAIASFRSRRVVGDALNRWSQQQPV